MAQTQRPYGSMPGLPDLGLSDLAELLGGQSNRLFELGAPLQERSYGILNDLLSGNDASGTLARLAGPSISALQGQLPNVQRQLTDAIGSGGALAEAQTRAITGQQSEIAKMLSGLQNSLLGTAMDTGLGLTQQVTAPLTAAGGLRAVQKQAGQKAKK